MKKDVCNVLLVTVYKKRSYIVIQIASPAFFFIYWTWPAEKTIKLDQNAYCICSGFYGLKYWFLVDVKPTYLFDFDIYFAKFFKK